MAAPGAAIATETRTASTLIHHFDRSEQHESTTAAFATTDDVVTAEQIDALNELLALPLGPEEDIQIDDWA